MVSTVVQYWEGGGQIVERALGRTSLLFWPEFNFLMLYRGPPLMWPPVGNENCGRIRGVDAGEGEQS